MYIVGDMAGTTSRLSGTRRLQLYIVDRGERGIGREGEREKERETIITEFLRLNARAFIFSG